MIRNTLPLPSKINTERNVNDINIKILTARENLIHTYSWSISSSSSLKYPFLDSRSTFKTSVDLQV